ICASFSSNFALPDWYAVSSFVQPPVKAATKKASTTVFFPRKSESFTGLLSVSGSVKSGASSPALSCVFGGVIPCWAERTTANRVQAANVRSAFIGILTGKVGRVVPQVSTAGYQIGAAQAAKPSGAKPDATVTCPQIDPVRSFLRISFVHADLFEHRHGLRKLRIEVALENIQHFDQDRIAQ